MKISIKNIYGLTSLLDLTLYSKNQPVTLTSIAQRNHLSKSYLEQIFPELRKEHLIVSVLGSKGGYRLADDPKSITVKQVIEALNGNLSVVAQMPIKDDNSMESSFKKYIWDVIDLRIQSIMDSLTLEELASIYKQEEMTIINEESLL